MVCKSSIDKLLRRAPPSARKKAENLAKSLRLVAIGDEHAPGDSTQCQACTAQIRAGILCACGRAWHSACALASLPKAYQHVVPVAGIFATDARVSAFTCASCRYARVSVGTTDLRVKDILDRIEALGPDAIHDFADDVAGHPVRKSLPGALSRSVGAARFIFAEIVAEASARATAGSPSADLVVAFAPRLFLRKGYTLHECVEQLLSGRSPEPPIFASTRLQRAAHALASGVREQRRSYTLRVLERYVCEADYGQRDPPSSNVVEELFPQQAALDGETDRLKALRDRFSDLQRVEFSDRDLKKWASGHLTSAGGFAGWTGAILLDLFGIRKDAAVLLTKLWTRPVDAWSWPNAARILWRHCDGWLLPKTNGWRPIGAPQLPRRVAGGAALRCCLPLVRRYCEARGQFGLSAEPAVLAYTYAATLHTLAGGVIAFADRAKSYQTIERRAVVDALEDVINSVTPAERGMAARLLDAVDQCWSESPDLGVTRVCFDTLDCQVQARGLAQGCTVSVMLQAIVLAWWACRERVECAMAHDDLWMDEGTVLPSCECIGGAYNPGKCASSSSDEPLVIWGRPINRFAHFAHEIWLGRSRARCRAIADIATVDFAAAVAAIDRLGGPLASAIHWLKALPPAAFNDSYKSSSVIDALRLAEKDWVDLLATIAGENALPDPERAFGSSWGFGTERPSGCAHRFAADGLARGFAGAVALGSNLGLDVGRWALLVNLPVDIPGGASLGDTAARAAATRTVQALLDSQVEPRSHIPPRALNLWLLALRPPCRLPDLAPLAWVSRKGPVDRNMVLRVAFRRVLDLPVWPALGISPQVDAPCTLCAGVINQPLRGGVGARLDRNGKHVTACVAVRGPCGNVSRHDSLARAAAEMGRLIGLDSFYHNGPLIDRGPGEQRRYRPADWFTRDDNCGVYPLGVCHDITIRAVDGTALAGVENDKIKKYKPFFDSYPGLGFQPFAVSLDGNIGPQAAATLQRWARRLAASRIAVGEPAGQPHDDVLRAFARAFAAVIVAQLAEYASQYVLNGAASQLPRKRASPMAGRHLQRLGVALLPRSRSAPSSPTL